MPGAYSVPSTGLITFASHPATGSTRVRLGVSGRRDDADARPPQLGSVAGQPCPGFGQADAGRVASPGPGEQVVEAVRCAQVHGVVLVEACGDGGVEDSCCGTGKLSSEFFRIDFTL